MPVPRPSPIVAIGWMLVAGLFFTALDAVSKQLALTHPPAQVTWLRYSIHAATFLAFLAATGRLADARTRRPSMHVVRGGLLILASICLVISVRTQPLSLVYAISFIAPLEIVAMAALFLRERISRLTLALIVVAFLGVLLIVRPGATGWSVAALVPILMATFNAGYQVMTRQMSATERLYALHLYPGVVGAVGLAVPGLLGWVPLDLFTGALVLLLGWLGLIGQACLTVAYSRAEAAVVAPFAYVQLIWAVLIDALIFGVLPPPTTWAGAALVIGSGLVLFGATWRRHRGDGPPGRPPASS